MATEETPQRAQQHEDRGLSPRAIASIVAAVVITAIVVVWLMRNRDSVEVDWLVTTTEAPIAVVILIAAVMGWLIGSLTWAILRHRRRGHRD